MSLDFALTQCYRVLLDDLVLLFDAYRFYTGNKPYHQQSIGEFAEVLANLTDQETQTLDDFVVKKSTNDSEEGMGTIVWDYLHSVLIRYLLDDASQYPFWTSKMRIFFSKKPFGMPMLKAFQQMLHDRFFHGKLRQMYAGFGPYLIASAAVNVDYLVKVTKNFIFSVLSKIPSPPSLTDVRKNHSHELLAHARSSIPGLAGMTRAPSISWGAKKDKEKDNAPPPVKTSWILSMATTIVTTLASHPNLVVATHMATNPLCTGSPWAVATIKIMTDYGLGAFYMGLKSRLFINLLPFTSYVIMGIADNILYRNIMSVTSSGHHHHHDLAAAGAGDSQMITYLNYSLLTLAHVIPSFCSFVAMRAVSRLIFGCSVHRKHQHLRRKEIVEGYLAKTRKIREAKEKKV